MKQPWRTIRDGAFFVGIALGAASLHAEFLSNLPDGSLPHGSSRPSLSGSAQDEPGSDPSAITRKAAVSVDFLRHPITEPARRMLRKALEAMNAGNHEAAREQLLKTLSRHPDSAAYVHSLLGIEDLKTARFDEAVRSFEQAAQLLPHDAKTHYNYSVSLSCVRDYDSAERELRRALELDPADADAQALVRLLAGRKQPQN